jgi:hypothetical protein
VTRAADPTPDAGLAAQLNDCYEQLRQEVLAGTGRSLGLALLVREGMAGWMHACSTWMHAPPSRPCPRSDTGLPEGVPAQLALLLAGMALSTSTASKELAS